MGKRIMIYLELLDGQLTEFQMKNLVAFQIRLICIYVIHLIKMSHMSEISEHEYYTQF